MWTEWAKLDNAVIAAAAVCQSYAWNTVGSIFSDTV